jgi:cellulose synthase/poly-beta-1,6-N-acetylglucosamine synthase-like glycosyltransferase
VVPVVPGLHQGHEPVRVQRFIPEPAVEALHLAAGLAINDGSTDRTAKAIRSFSDDGRVTVVDIPDIRAARGKSAALNWGLRLARHSLIAMYDADNMPEPGALRPLVEELIHDSSLGATVGMYRVVNRYRNLLRRLLNVEGISFQWIVQLAAGC